MRAIEAFLGAVGVVEAVFLGLALAQAEAFPGLRSPATFDWPWFFLSPLAPLFFFKEIQEYADRFLQRMFR